MIAFTWLLWTERNGIDFSTRFILMDRVVVTLEDDDAGSPHVQVRDFHNAEAARIYAIRETASFEAAKWEFTGSVMMDLITFTNLDKFLERCRDPEALSFVVRIVNQLLQHGRELG